MPRPKHAPESRRDHHIGVRFAAPEYEKVRAEAERIGVTLSGYIRAKTIHGHLRIPKYARIDAQAISLLSKLGGLLKMVHTESGGAYSGKTAEILDEIKAILVTIRSRLEEAAA